MKHRWTIKRIKDNDSRHLICNRPFCIYGDYSHREWTEIASLKESVAFSYHLRDSRYGPANKKGIRVNLYTKIYKVQFLQDVWIHLDETTQWGIALSLEKKGDVHLTNGIYRLTYEEDWGEEQGREQDKIKSIRNVLLGQEIIDVQVKTVYHDTEINEVQITTAKGSLFIKEISPTYEGGAVIYAEEECNMPGDKSKEKIVGKAYETHCNECGKITYGSHKLYSNHCVFCGSSDVIIKQGDKDVYESEI